MAATLEIIFTSNVSTIFIKNKESEKNIMIKGVIFDFNGTLFYDTPQQEKAWREFAWQNFRRSISDQEFKELVHGRNTDFTLEYLADRSLSKAEVDAYVKAKETVYIDICEKDPQNTHLNSGAERLLDELKERGLPLAIATAAPKINVDYYIRKFNLECWFPLDKIIYNDGTIKGKPAPDFYLKAAQTLQLDSKDCLVFEDAISGIQAAYNANIGKIVAITTTDMVEKFKHMTELCAVIDSFDNFNRSILS